MPEEACRAPPYRAATRPFETGATGEGGSSSQAAEDWGVGLQRGRALQSRCGQLAGAGPWGKVLGSPAEPGVQDEKAATALSVIPSPWFSCHPPIQTDFYQTFFLNAIFHSLAF